LLNLPGPGKCKTKAGSMGLNYVRQDQTVPGADRLSAGPRCNAARAAFWERRRNWGAASRAEKHVRKITRLPMLEFTTAACWNAPGGASNQRFSQLTKIRIIALFSAASWNGRTTDI